MLPVIEAFTEDIKKVNTLLQLATLTRNILQKLTIKDIQVVTLPDSYFKFKFITEDGSTIETNSVFIGESISIDDALSLISTNPVQNKIITQAISTINEAISNIQTDIENMEEDITRIDNTLTNVGVIKYDSYREHIIQPSQATVLDRFTIQEAGTYIMCAQLSTTVGYSESQSIDIKKNENSIGVGRGTGDYGGGQNAIALVVCEVDDEISIETYGYYTGGGYYKSRLSIARLK